MNSSGEPAFSKMEALFYEAARLEEIDIPYRGVTNGFYLSGSGRVSNRVLVEELRTDIESEPEKPYSLIFPRDLYGLSEEILSRATLEIPTKDSKFSYVFSATIKDNHIYASLTLLNLEQNKPHCTILFNSWPSEEYFNSMKYRLNLPYNGEYGGFLKDLSAPPVLNGSIKIQINNDGGNCSLYTNKLLQAIYFTVANSPELRKQLEQLPTDDLEAAKEWDKMFPQFKHQIQERLPEFFRTLGSGFTLRPYSERKKWLLEKRWQIGQSYILEQHKQVTTKLYNDIQALDNIDAYLNKTQITSPVSSPNPFKREQVHCVSGVEHAGKDSSVIGSLHEESLDENRMIAIHDVLSEVQDMRPHVLDLIFQYGANSDPAKEIPKSKTVPVDQRPQESSTFNLWYLGTLAGISAISLAVGIAALCLTFTGVGIGLTILGVCGLGVGGLIVAGRYGLFKQGAASDNKTAVLPDEKNHLSLATS